MPLVVVGGVLVLEGNTHHCCLHLRKLSLKCCHYLSRMTLISSVLTFVIVLAGVCSAFSQSRVHTQKVLVSSQSDLQSNAVLATNTLLGWYNQTSGLWQTTSWWNAANCITTLATLTQLSPNLDYVTRKI